MGVEGGEEPFAGSEVGVVESGLDKVAGEPLAAVRCVHPDVAEVGEAGAVGNDAEVGGLGAVFESTENEGGVLCGA